MSAAHQTYKSAHMRDFPFPASYFAKKKTLFFSQTIAIYNRTEFGEEAKTREREMAKGKPGPQRWIEKADDYDPAHM